MRLKEKDLANFAKLFQDLCNGKYKICVISKDEEEYLYDPTMVPEDNFDHLVLRTLMASLNTVLLDHELSKEAPHLITDGKPIVKYEEKKERFSAYSNSYLWSTVSKVPQ
jgi:hypothetical protein